MNRLLTGVLLLCAMATGEAQTTSEDHQCSGYFCDKAIHEIAIVMTHNSLAHKRGAGRNQIGDLVQQFRDGVRGFNFDLYPCPSGRTCKKDMWHRHGWGHQAYDPYDQIRDLRDELNLQHWRNEIIVIQLEGSGNNGGKQFLEDIFDGLTTVFNLGEDATLEDDINLNKRVWITTTVGSGNDSIICENTYKWQGRYDLMPVERREHQDDYHCTVTEATSPVDDDDPSSSYPVLLMNSFIGGRANARDYANRECRLVENARRFAESGNYESSGDRAYPNIIMVDFYQDGDVFEAVDCLRANDSCLEMSC